MDVLNITNVPTPLHIKLKIIAIAMVTRIVTQRDLTYMEQIFKVVYLLSFSLFWSCQIWLPSQLVIFLHFNIWLEETLSLYKVNLLQCKMVQYMQNNNPAKLISVQIQHCV